MKDQTKTSKNAKLTFFIKILNAFNHNGKEEHKSLDALLTKGEYWGVHKDKFVLERYGFKKAIENGVEIYYALLECPPHAYVDGDKYYVFKNVPIALPIPFEKKDKIGKVAMIENGLEKTIPYILDAKYRHPSIQSYVGEPRRISIGDYRINEVIETDFKRSMEAEKWLSEDEIKARKVAYILRKTVSSIINGLNKGIGPITPFSYLKPKTKSEFERWQDEKTKEGWPKINAVPL